MNLKSMDLAWIVVKDLKKVIADLQKKEHRSSAAFKKCLELLKCKWPLTKMEPVSACRTPLPPIKGVIKIFCTL